MDIQAFPYAEIFTTMGLVAAVIAALILIVYIALVIKHKAKKAQNPNDTTAFPHATFHGNVWGIFIAVAILASIGVGLYGSTHKISEAKEFIDHYDDVIISINDDAHSMTSIKATDLEKWLMDSAQYQQHRVTATLQNSDETFEDARIIVEKVDTPGLSHTMELTVNADNPDDPSQDDTYVEFYEYVNDAPGA